MSDALYAVETPHVILNHFFIDDLDFERYRAMARDYHLTCSKRPFVKRCDLAFMIGARQFHVAPDDLRQCEPGGGRMTPLVETRQKLMAFARIVSERDDIVNSWKKIGKVFNRSHSTVIHAAHKYGEVIAAALA